MLMSIDSFIQESRSVSTDCFPHYTRRYVTVKNLVRDVLCSTDGYDSEADGYVYVLKCEFQLYNDIYYYIGCVTKGDLESRISGHVTERYFEAPVRYEDVMLLGDIRDYSDEYVILDVIDVDSYCKGDKEYSVFKKTILNKEREKSYQVAIDKNTTNIIGGK